jgi:outer membrane protein assembly factor BamB
MNVRVLARPETLVRLRWTVRVSMVVLAALVVAGPASAALAQVIDPPRAVVAGTVFADRDGDGERGGREPGVAGVSVSDGVTIVATDAGGRYRLELDPQRRITDLVFITQPAGYAVPTDEFMTPRFYRDLGELADGDERSADFPLRPDPRSRSSNFSFANVADPHVNPQLAEQIRQINATSQDLGFIQVSGDLTNNATDAEFTRYREAVAGSGLPVWPAVGNHEYFTGGGTDYPARIDNYRRYVGPEWYSFDYGDRHFLVLEDNGQAPFEEQLEWVGRDLAANAEGRRLVVLTHQPMNVPFGSPSQYDAYGELLESYGAELVLVGHEHSNDVEPDSTWVSTARHVQTNSSSYTIDNSPRGFRYVHMRGNRFENPFRMYGVERMLTITDPAPGSEIPASAFTGVQVNAYHTSDEVARLRYQLDGGAWRRMRATGELTWHARLAGVRPGPGAHTIEVEAVGADGERWRASSTFTLSDEPPAVPTAGADWSQHHGGATHAGVAADALAPGLRLAWSHRTPGSFLTGSPVIADGVVYAGTRDEDGDGASAVHAVDLATGQLRWVFPVPSSVHGTVAVDGGRVFVPSVRGSLFALDANDGSLLWRRDPEPAEPPTNQEPPVNQRAYSYYSPAVADGTVFWAYQTRFGPASQGLLTALDPATGAAIWEAPMTGATMSDGAPAVADGRVYVGNQTADRVIAYDAGTGAQLWVSSAVLGGWQDGVPTAAGGRVFIGANNGIAARDAATGADLWSFRSPYPSHVSSGATPSTPAVDGDTVYMGFPSGAVTALDARTGAVRWDRLLPGDTYFGGVHSSPVVSGDTVFVGANNGRLYALDRATGQPRWQYEIGTWVAAGPAVSGNALVAGAWDGNLYAFTPGGVPAPRWATVSGTVTDPASGAALPGTRVVASRSGAEPTATTTDAEGRYEIGLEPGTYTVSTTRRGYLTNEQSSGTVEVGESGAHSLDLELVEVTGPVTGTGTIPPDYGPASTRVDVSAGDSYHFAMNELVQATITTRTASNNQPGAFVPGSLADLFLLDDTATETLDWSELILSETSNDPNRPWGRSGEWLDLTSVGLDGDRVVAAGPAQIDPSLHATVSYRVLPGAPVVKATVEIENTGSGDFEGYFQYLIDPDSSDDSALVPGIEGANPGFLTDGWTGNYLYAGPQTPIRSPAHGIAWAADQPVGLTAFGYIAGVWFDASVAAGQTRTISWYHITDYPAAGSPAANVAGWAEQLDTLDPELAVG